jgi:molybdenum cofactor guanylyltransferase
MTRLLGAVLAGGAARRFGGDKALADAGGCSLIDRVIAALAPQCDALVIVGRVHGDWPTLPDRPGAGQGPLAALNAALHHGAAQGYDAVLSAPCDVPDVPDDLAAQLGPAPAVVADQPVIGLWPTALAAALDAWLAAGERSVHRFAAGVGARRTLLSSPLANINSPSDLAQWRQAQLALSSSTGGASSLSTQPG